MSKAQCKCYQSSKNPKTKVTVYEGKINGFVVNGVPIHPLHITKGKNPTMEYDKEQFVQFFGTANVEEFIKGMKKLPCSECFVCLECAFSIG